MSLSMNSYTYNRKTFEDAEFPILCETCLGSNPYIRMSKDTFGGECKICERPFTTFRWMPGRGARYKKTEICQTCAKLKNVCQTCMLDLEYGLPVQVRDHALAIKEDVPKMGSNRDYYIQNADRALAKTDGTTPGGQLALVANAGTNEMLQKLARNQPYYNRNLPHICSFFVKGECKRGEECPYRHEKPTDPDDPLSQQNIRDRYYGTNDPVADKLLNRAKAMPKLTAPDDPTITTLYLGNLATREGIPKVTEEDIRGYFYQFGEIRMIHMGPEKFYAFIQFTTRASAEMAAERTFQKLVLNGQQIRVRWGQPKAQQGAQNSAPEHTPLAAVPNIVDICPVPSDFLRPGSSGGFPVGQKRPHPGGIDLAPPPPPKLVVPNVPYQQTGKGGGKGPGGKEGQQHKAVYYPSMDPHRLGARGDVVDRE